MPGPARVRRAARAGIDALPRGLRSRLGRSPSGSRGRAPGDLVSVVVVCQAVDLPRLQDTVEALVAEADPEREVLVAPVGEDVARAVGEALRDLAGPRLRVLADRATWQEAADLGASSAAGRFLCFRRACDPPVRGALALLAGRLAASGSDLAVGAITQRGRPAPWLERSSRAAHAEPATGLAPGLRPALAGDLGLGNKLFVTAHWRSVGARLAPSDGWLLSPAVAGCLAGARSVDVVARPVQEHAGGHGVRAFATTPNRLRDLPEWTRRAELVSEILAGSTLLDGWCHHVLDVAMPGFLRDTERATEEEWRLLRRLVAGFAEECGGSVSTDELSTESRVLTWLAAEGRRRSVEQLCEELHELAGDVPTVLAGDAVEAAWSSLPDDVPRELRRLQVAETPLVASLRSWGSARDVRPVEILLRIPQVDLARPAVEVTVRTPEGRAVEVRPGDDAAATRWGGSALHRAVGVRVDVDPACPWLELALRVGGLQRGTRLELTDPHTRPARPDPDVVVRGLALRGGGLQVALSGPGELRLVDERGDVLGRATAEQPDIALRAPFFGRERWLPTGFYRLITSAGPATVTDELVATLPLEVVGERHRLRATLGPAGGLLLHLGAPLADEEQGRWAQHRLVTSYREDRTPVDHRVVYFESYAGRWATDSPRAVHAELVRRRPDLTTYWGVLDHAQQVPPGATPVLLRSREHFAVLARAGAIVLNTDVEAWFRRRPGQVLMQTFHGYPSKGMGRSQWEASELPPSRVAELRARGVDTWSVILTPSPEMTRHYREQYDYAGPALEHGYPRNDDLLAADAAQRRHRVRELLGIRPQQRAVLYAPTWREHLAVRARRAETTALLDVELATRELGDGYVLLLRGHRFHLPGSSGDRALDVTEYPEINDLILAADVAVLDYSSLRFDFALTGRPMVFLVPDLEQYGRGTRSFLFPFEDSAPGPFVADTRGVLDEVRDVDALAGRWAPELARFNATYQAWQDGRSSQRAVDYLLQALATATATAEG